MYSIGSSQNPAKAQSSLWLKDPVTANPPQNWHKWWHVSHPSWEATNSRVTSLILTIIVMVISCLQRPTSYISSWNLIFFQFHSQKHETEEQTKKATSTAAFALSNSSSKEWFLESNALPQRCSLVSRAWKKKPTSGVYILESCKKKIPIFSFSQSPLKFKKHLHLILFLEWGKHDVAQPDVAPKSMHIRAWTFKCLASALVLLKPMTRPSLPKIFSLVLVPGIDRFLSIPMWF